MKVAILAFDNRVELGCYETSRPLFSFAVSDLLCGFAGFDECEIHVISCGKKPLTINGDLAGNIVFHGVEVPQWGWLRTLYSGCIQGIKRKLREIQPDVVHGQGTERYCGMAAVLSGYPNLVTVHGNVRSVARFMSSRPFSYLWVSARMERFVLSKASGVICLSEYGKNLVQPVNGRVWQIPNAVDVNFFDVPRCSDGKTLLCLADVVSYKNQIGLINALDGLALMNKYQLVFAGRLAGDNQYCKEFLAKIEERSWCRYEGSISRTRVRELLQMAVATILPSFQDNYPMAILEAMAVGVPVAASRIGGISDIIKDRYNGLLFDPQSSESIRRAVRVLLEESEITRNLGLKGKAMVADFNSPEEIALKHINAYRELVAMRKEHCLRIIV